MIVVFTGPTLPPSQVPALPDLRVLPPVAHGDVYRVAARDRPWGIAIVDGYFEHTPAVWHKEILWAMAQGIYVFGASSMGALRAAELADFGMVGVGRVFEQFRDGTLTSDDEVTVAHLSAAREYRCVSEALVNMRATMDAAIAARACRPELAEHLISLARQQFYPLRSWPAVLAAAAESRTDLGELEALERWLPDGRIDQKRHDALAMLDVMQAARAASPQPMRVGFTFQHTDLWERAVDCMRDRSDDPAASPETGALLDELRLRGNEQLYTVAMQGALLRGLSEHLTERRALRVDRDLVAHSAHAFRCTRGLHTEAAMATWLSEQGLDRRAFYEMMTREARLRWTEAVFGRHARHHIIDQLRAMGSYGQLRARAQAKHRALDREEMCPSHLETDRQDDEALWRWYFQTRVGKPVPDDLASYAERLGFADADALKRAVLLERWYTTLTAS